MLSFLFRRFLAILATLFVVTLVLYGLAMLTPPEARAELFLPKTNRQLTEAQHQRLIEITIRRYGLDQPLPIQYAHWLGRLLQGEWGYSPTAHTGVLEALLVRTPASAELILYSLLLYIPLGVVAGLQAAVHQEQRPDLVFRLAAFTVSAIPPFILALVLLTIFWVGLYWFPAGRLSTAVKLYVDSGAFQRYTGLVTLDGLLNLRPDISLDALRHLVLPVLTLSLSHLAILGRITRAVTLEELGKPYILAARGRGIPEKRVIWKHAFRNVLVPALNSSALSAASLVTSLFIVETIFMFNGLSSLITRSLYDIPDVTAMLGFAIYSVIAVLLMMTVLDLFQAALDPRLRLGERST